MRIFYFILVGLMLVLSSHASAYIYISNNDGAGNYTLNWTYNSYNSCKIGPSPGSAQAYYKTINAFTIKESLNGARINTYIVSSGGSVTYTPPSKRYVLRNKEAGVYTYEITVTSCSSSGETSYVAGSRTFTIDVSNSSRPNKPVIFIHTDVLGSPVAETDEQGNVIQ